jgi:hypothetical protein
VQEEDDAVSPLGRAAGHDHLVVQKQVQLLRRDCTGGSSGLSRSSLSWTEYTRLLLLPSRKLSTWWSVVMGGSATCAPEIGFTRWSDASSAVASQPCADPTSARRVWQVDPERRAARGAVDNLILVAVTTWLVLPHPLESSKFGYI